VDYALLLAKVAHRVARPGWLAQAAHHQCLNVTLQCSQPSWKAGEREICVLFVRSQADFMSRRGARRRAFSGVGDVAVPWWCSSEHTCPSIHTLPVLNTRVPPFTLSQSFWLSARLLRPPSGPPACFVSQDVSPRASGAARPHAHPSAGWGLHGAPPYAVGPVVACFAFMGREKRCLPASPLDASNHWRGLSRGYRSDLESDSTHTHHSFG